MFETRLRQNLTKYAEDINGHAEYLERWRALQRHSTPLT
jgi:homogentisate 1,2-dioxygenase